MRKKIRKKNNNNTAALSLALVKGNDCLASLPFPLLQDRNRVAAAVDDDDGAGALNTLDQLRHLSSG